MKPRCPCGPNCPKRSISCKFDGTCDKWLPYEKAVGEYRVDRHKNRVTASTYMTGRVVKDKFRWNK